MTGISKTTNIYHQQPPVIDGHPKMSILCRYKMCFFTKPTIALEHLLPTHCWRADVEMQMRELSYFYFHTINGELNSPENLQCPMTWLCLFWTNCERSCNLFTLGWGSCDNVRQPPSRCWPTIVWSTTYHIPKKVWCGNVCPKMTNPFGVCVCVFVKCSVHLDLAWYFH